MPTLQHLQRQYGVISKEKARDKAALATSDTSELLIVDSRAGRSSKEMIEQKLRSLQVTPLPNRPR
jgi:hypothetical protein